MGIIAAPELIPLDSSRKSQEPSGFLALGVSGLVISERGFAASRVPSETKNSCSFLLCGELR